MDPLKKELQEIESIDEKRDFLEAHAYSTETANLPYHFTEDELADHEKRLANAAITIYRAQVKLDRAKELFKSETEESKAIRKETIPKLAKGFETREQTLYGIADHDAGRMYFYTEQGKMIDSRALYPGERQAKFTLPNK